MQSETATKNSIAIHPYGSVIAPIAKVTTVLPLEIQMDGVIYKSTGSAINTWNVGTKFTFNKAGAAKNDPDTPTDLTKKSKK